MSKEQAHEIVDLENEIESLQHNYNNLVDYYNKEYFTRKELFNKEEMYLEFNARSNNNSYIFELHMPTILKSIKEFIEFKEKRLDFLVNSKLEV